MSAQRSSSRFRIRLEDGSEVPVASVEALARRIERHEVLPDTPLYDGSTGEWASAGDCSVACFIVEELIGEGQLLPEEWTESLAEPSGASAERTEAADAPASEVATPAEETAEAAAEDAAEPDAAEPAGEVSEAAAEPAEASDEAFPDFSLEGASDDPEGSRDDEESTSIADGSQDPSDLEVDSVEVEVPDEGAREEPPSESGPSDGGPLDDFSPDGASSDEALLDTDAPDGNFLLEGFTLADEATAAPDDAVSSSGASPPDEPSADTAAFDGDESSLRFESFADDDAPPDTSGATRDAGAAATEPPHAERPAATPGSEARDDPWGHRDDPWGHELPEASGPPVPTPVEAPVSEERRGGRRVSLLLLTLAAAAGLLVDHWIGGSRPIPAPSAIVVAPQPPAPPPELEGIVGSALAGVTSRFQGAVDSLRVLNGVPTGPPEAWLGGDYLANAGEFPGVRTFWESYATVVDQLGARDRELFAAAIDAVSDGYPPSQAVPLEGYLRARYAHVRQAREARYYYFGLVASRALDLHDFLEARQDDLEFTPAVGVAVPLDPVLEVGTPDAALRGQLNAQLDAFFDALYRARGGGPPAEEGLESDLFSRFAGF